MRSPGAAAIRYIAAALGLLLLTTPGASAGPGEPLVAYNVAVQQEAHAFWIKRISPSIVVQYHVFAARTLFASDYYGPTYQVIAGVGKARCTRTSGGKIVQCKKMRPAHAYRIRDEDFKFDPLLRKASVRFNVPGYGLQTISWNSSGDYEPDLQGGPFLCGANVGPGIVRPAHVQAFILGKQMHNAKEAAIMQWAGAVADAC